MPSPKLVPTSIQVACLAACAPDSSDRGSARIRLPAAAWIAASVPYHSPVLVTIEDGCSPEPWRLLCISASLEPPGTPPTPPSPSPSPSPSPTPPHHDPSNPQHQHQEPFAVVDPTVVCVPPGRNLSHLPGVLASRPAATLLPCRGPITAATEVVVEVPPGLEHLATTLRFKLHQALVAMGHEGGCHVRLSDTVAVRVVSALPVPALARGTASVAGEPALLRIVPSTRILLATPHCQGQQQQQQQQQQQEKEQQEQQQGRAQLSAPDGLHGGTSEVEGGQREGGSGEEPAAEGGGGPTGARAAEEGRSKGTKKASSKGSKSKASAVGTEVEVEDGQDGSAVGAASQGAGKGADVSGPGEERGGQEGGEAQGTAGEKKKSSAKSKAGGEKKKKSTKGKGISASTSAFSALMGLDDEA